MSVYTDNVVMPISNSLSGWLEVADATTLITPITQELIEGGNVYLTNDGLGTSSTTDFNLYGASNPWNSTSNSLNFLDSGLKLGDNILTRIDIKITPEIIPLKLSLVYEYFTGPDGSGTKITEYIKELGELTTSAGVEYNFIDETRFNIFDEVSAGSCRVYVDGSTRFNVKVLAFNFLIIRNK